MYTYKIESKHNKPINALIETLLITGIVLSVLTFIVFIYPFENLPKYRSFDIIVKLTLSGLFAAVVEEYFFRGLLQPLFKKRMSELKAIVAVNLIFAPLHLIVIGNPMLLLVFFPGMIMGLLKERYGYIWSPILFHFLCNIWAIWFSPLSL